MQNSELSEPTFALLRLILIHWAHAGRSVPPAMATLAGGGEQAASSVVYVTAPSEEVAKQLATSIVEKKLAACVNIIPGGCMPGPELECCVRESDWAC